MITTNDLKRLYEARKAYKTVEKEVYGSLSKKDLGSRYLGKIRAQVAVQQVFIYTKEFKNEMLKLYVKERREKKIKPEERIYVAFFEKKKKKVVKNPYSCVEKRVF
jgi:hypothetical protein